MKKDNKLKYIALIIFGICFAAGCYFLSERYFKKNEVTNNSNYPKKVYVKKVESEEESEEQTSNKTSNETSEKAITGNKNCNDLENDLNFTDGDIQYYCHYSTCSYNINRVISSVVDSYNYIIKIANTKGSVSEENKIMIDVYDLENGKISLVKNGDEKNKLFLSNIDDAKTFRIHQSVQPVGIPLFVLNDKNELYLYYIDEENNQVSDGKLLMKNVKNFDTFEGNDYKLCVGESEGQNIQIAVHTTDGKFIQASPFDLARANQ